MLHALCSSVRRNGRPMMYDCLADKFARRPGGDEFADLVKGQSTVSADAANTNISYSNVEIRITAEDSRFDFCTFDACRMTDKTLAGVTFSNCAFQGISFLARSIIDCKFENCSFSKGARDDDSKFSNCKFSETVFESCRLDSVSFASCDMSRLKINGCLLIGCFFDKSSFIRNVSRDVAISEFQILQSNLVSIDLSRMDLSNIDAYATRFEACDFSKSDLNSANLGRCSFEACQFDGTNLASASIRGANFNQTDLSGIQDWYRAKVSDDEGKSSLLRALGFLVS